MDRNQMLGIVEGASAGVLASMLHARPESEAFFRGAIVPGSGPVHVNHKMAPPNPEGAITLAQLARESLSADVGVSVTPINMDDGNVYIGMVSDNGSHVETGRFPRRNPEWVMQRSATTAIVHLMSSLNSNRI